MGEIKDNGINPTYMPDFSDILSDHEVQGLMAYTDFMGKQ